MFPTNKNNKISIFDAHLVLEYLSKLHKSYKFSLKSFVNFDPVLLFNYNDDHFRLIGFISLLTSN
jgi:hypothetical protein